MGFLKKISTGWKLAVDSIKVLRDEPSLAVLPFVGGIAGLAYLALVLGGSYATLGLEQGPVLYAVLFVLYFGLTFVASFTNAALVYCAAAAFAGREVSITEGLGAAWSHKGRLAVWAAISATVGLIFRALDASDNLLAEIAVMLFSAAWGVMTYFIVPIIVFEETSIRGMFRRSTETFAETWGETAGAEFGIGFVTVILGFVGVMLAGMVFVAFGATPFGVIGAVAVGGSIIVATAVFATALAAIAKTALYVYAAHGHRPAQFDNVDFESMG